jgi:hypothetical protein
MSEQYDRVRQLAVVTGLGNILLGAAVLRHVAFPAVHQVGDDEIFYCLEATADNVDEWEVGMGTLVDTTHLSRDTILASSNGGAKVNFTAGAQQIFQNVPAHLIRKFVRTDAPLVTALAQPATATHLMLDGDGVVKRMTPENYMLQYGTSVTALQSITPANNHVVNLTAPDGSAYKATMQAVKDYMGVASAPSDMNNPSAPTNLQSSNVTQTSYTITFTPGTDDVGVARSEWSLDASTWTPIGSATTFNVSNRTAGSTDTMRVRTVDTSGNVSDPATLAVVLQQATASDGSPPTWLAGSLTASNITGTSYTLNIPEAQDNVAVDKKQISLNGGTDWTDIAANATTHPVTGRTKGTTDQVRARALDAAGNISNVLSLAVLNATAPAAPTIGAATHGDGTMTQAFTAPADNGGSAITQFTLRVYNTSNVLVGTFTGTTSPITATGLTNGVSVYGKVSATNTVGTGAESAASNTVTPAAAVPQTMKEQYPLVSSYQMATTATRGAVSNPELFSISVTIQIKNASDAYPASGEAKIFWIRSADGTLPADIPNALKPANNGNAWPTLIPYSVNGGATSGTAPGSVRTLNRAGAATYFTPSSSLFGAGATGTYFPVVAFNDLSYTIVNHAVVVTG